MPAVLIDRLCPPETVVTMSQYTALLGIDELEFWGVYQGPGPIDPPTRYWTGQERKMLGDHLLRAERMIEAFMRVHLEPKWTEDDPVVVATGITPWEENPWEGNPHEVNWKRFIACGRKTITYYLEHAPIVYAGDFGTVTVAHGGVGNATELHIWYDNTQYPIEPSAITWGPINIVIQFPRERLVDPNHMMPPQNQDQQRGVMWETQANFLETLTVARVWHDSSTCAELIYTEMCDCGGTGCERCCQTACMVPSVPRVGTVNIYPATYNATTGAWGRTSCWLSYTPSAVRYAYRSGMRTLPYELMDAVVRLAHTLMPDNPCPIGRDPQHHFWARDRIIREISIREVLNCPWGNMAGAWFAWNVCVNHDENYGKGGGFM
jgi:hypothetical protein